MKSAEELRLRCERIEEEIKEKYIDANGMSWPIIDGIVDIEKYYQTNPKILWILKEPYDYVEDGKPSGGGWHFSKHFLGTDDFYKKIGKSHNTWHPLLYVSYSIIHNFIEYDDMPFLRNDLSMVEIIKQIAVINVKKLPGFTRTANFATIESSYHKNKQLLHNQIETYDPDIVIGASTMHLFFDRIGVKHEEVIRNGSLGYAIKNGKLYIAAYHPGQTLVKRDVYVNDIVNTVKSFLETLK